MKVNKKLKTVMLGGLFVATAHVYAATAFQPAGVISKPKDGQPVTVDVKGLAGTGWISPSMSYLGWTHQTAWFFIDVAKGKTVTIDVDAVTPNNNKYLGFHPGLTVWYRDTKLSAADSQLYYMNDHFYKQSASINAPTPMLEGTTTKLNPIKMDYVDSAYDLDGLGDMITDKKGKVFGPYLPFPYNTPLTGPTGINAGDNDKGKLSMTFTATKGGVYQIALGGLVPDAGSPVAGNDSYCSIAKYKTQTACIADPKATWFDPWANANVTFTVY